MVVGQGVRSKNGRLLFFFFFAMILGTCVWRLVRVRSERGVRLIVRLPRLSAWVSVVAHLELSPLVNGVDQCHRLPVRDLNTREIRRY